MRLCHNGHADRGCQRVQNLTASDTAQVDEVTSAAMEVRLATAVGYRGEHDVAACLEIERRDDELPEPGLPEVLEQQLGVTAAQFSGLRLPGRRGSPEELPQRFPEVPQSGFRAPGGADDAGPPASAVTLRVAE